VRRAQRGGHMAVVRFGFGGGRYLVRAGNGGGRGIGARVFFLVFGLF
jgi:hypothetical protein